MGPTITERPERPRTGENDRTAPAGTGLLPLAPPSRRTLLLGVGTLGASLALGTGTALAERPKLRSGSRGSAVTTLQKRLAALHYWCGSADGSFGHLTQQAVYAIQKAAGLIPDGVVGPKTWGALDRGVQPSRRGASLGFEVNLDRQLLICSNHGRIAHIFNTSTGSGERYYSGGRWKTATTPKGSFAMYSLYSSGWQSGPLGNMYRPGYYDRGWAIHGSTSIPPYPASHGCSRISVAASNFLWSGKGWFVKGRKVLIY